MSVKKKVFLDTNVIVYLYSEDESEKQKISELTAETYDCVISTQVLNEFCSLALNKLKIPLNTFLLDLDEIMREFSAVTITNELIRQAVELHIKYKYNFWDCLMLAAALAADCEYLFSEDMQDGQVIEKNLTIKNIYASVETGDAC